MDPTKYPQYDECPRRPIQIALQTEEFRIDGFAEVRIIARDPQVLFFRSDKKFQYARDFGHVDRNFPPEDLMAVVVQSAPANYPGHVLLKLVGLRYESDRIVRAELMGNVLRRNTKFLAP